MTQDDETATETTLARINCAKASRCRRDVHGQEGLGRSAADAGGERNDVLPLQNQYGGMKSGEAKRLKQVE